MLNHTVYNYTQLYIGKLVIKLEKNRHRFH